MDVLWLDAFHGGSHAAVARGYAAHSAHTVRLETLSIAGGWRWRMRGAAVTLARRVRQLPRPDLLIATDMLDVATFRGLAWEWADVPLAVYFHENQLTYPLPAGRKLDVSLPWINYTSALAADALMFNSAFHRDAFLGALPGLIGRYHDHQERDLVPAIAARSHVLSPGVDLARLDGVPPDTAQGSGDGGPPIILWNSRWEYDKQPEALFAALEELEAAGVPFRLIVAGEHIDPNAPAFVAARAQFAHRALWWGYAPEADYARLLHRADIVVTTAIQEFFGIAFIEALYAGCLPIAPRRLTYPELLPPAFHRWCLYDDAAGLVRLLTAALRGEVPLDRGVVRGAAAGYAWPRRAPHYDATFAAIAAAGRQRLPQSGERSTAVE